MKKYSSKILFLTLFTLSLIVSCRDTNLQNQTQENKIVSDEIIDKDLQNHLLEFHQNPSKVMDERVMKYDSEGNKKSEKYPFISTDTDLDKIVAKKNKDRNFILSLNENRKKYIENSKSLFREGDLVEELLPAKFDTVRNIFEMDQQKLTSGKVKTQPWSDDYWAIYKGILGFRYADPEMNSESDNWMDFRKYVEKNDIESLLSKGKIDLLSPSEKYDLLVGNKISKDIQKQTSLTDHMWSEGREYYIQNKGVVEGWMGICHGWAPASFALPRPIKPVAVYSADKKYLINFYPADIKALSSLLWANLPYNSKAVGGRCDVKSDELKKDKKTGRIIDQDCFDTNPGTWHLSIVNLVGKGQQSFVMDATFDYEVWNHPILSYEITYFNPETFKESKSSKNSIINLNEYSKDPFKKFRANNIKKIVGVQMRVNYLVETTPEQNLKESEELDAIESVKYVYDLELDNEGNILGGEWHTNKHPDFLWMPNLKVTTGETSYDQTLTNFWNSQKDELPSSWREQAQKASINSKLPLNKIIQELLRRSTLTTAE